MKTILPTLILLLTLAIAGVFSFLSDTSLLSLLSFPNISLSFCFSLLTLLHYFHEQEDRKDKERHYLFPPRHTLENCCSYPRGCLSHSLERLRLFLPCSH